MIRIRYGISVSCKSDLVDADNQVMRLDPLSPWNYESVLMEWVKVKLTDGLWKNVFTTASGVSVSLY